MKLATKNLSKTQLKEKEAAKASAEEQKKKEKEKAAADPNDKKGLHSVL